MGTYGKAYLKICGKRGLKESGRAACYLVDGTCPSCVDCQIETLAEQLLNPSQSWLLTSFQGPGQATPGSFWRIFLIDPCPAVYTEYWGKGCVDQFGELDALPDSISNYLGYQARVALQIGCLDTDINKILWPGTCHPETDPYPCP